MARTRSRRVDEVKEQLRLRLREGVLRPGDRFLSTREVAAAYAISYQTAHRVIGELCAEGCLERRPASGTYVPGKPVPVSEVQLFFHERARRPGSFGARLLGELREGLARDGIPVDLIWANEAIEPDVECFPVIWECEEALTCCRHLRRPALLLNDRPRPGLDAACIDSVSIDDYSGGASAAQLLLGGGEQDRSLAVLTGPATDARSNARRDGFLSVASDAAVVVSRGWYFEDGLAVAAEAARQGRDGVFCANDRLAEAVVACCRRERIACPRLIGFDDAPVAERLRLTTIAIPWEEMIGGACEIVRRRLAGDTSVARQLILTPRVVVRG